jgi:hypothetical protein
MGCWHVGLKSVFESSGHHCFQHEYFLLGGVETVLE